MNGTGRTRPLKIDSSRASGSGDLTIDPHAGEVAGPGGREKLDPKVMDVLVVLAQNAGTSCCAKTC